ncbi:ATP-binding protein [Chitinivibrio alkaliphilus]|uniref:histidine kinase n=1 Tax=Chitinivibrio alkaliphilus ACht1 TaxID=1313304 RepID=U7D547_9BACT|nr:ATP-binding protein [Chitinivibrio alkaliphilus]ERP31644.1 hypothetical protein CALK_1508 [Chitinivibrio alkaliphilus ACht1]
MKNFVGIKQKIIQSVMLMIAVIFLIIFAVLLGQNINRNRTRLEENRQQIIDGIKARGNILVKNNSTALRGMIADNAFSSIRDLVNATVGDEENPDIVRGICINRDRIPMAYAVAGEEIDPGFDPLDDPLTDWFIEQERAVDTTYIASEELGGIEVYEFSSPVHDEYTEEVIGYIRYTISAEPLREELARAEREARREILFMVLLLVCLMVGAIVMAYFVLTPIAQKITSPIIDLSESAKVISDGNYNFKIERTSDDEVGILSETFDEMRQTIKQYTEHLQDIIDDKMRQVKDILNNIDQGLMTLDFDGNIGEEYSLISNKILNVEDVSQQDVYSLLRLDTAGKKRFDTWLALVKKMHTKQRWKKIEKLAPIHELQFQTLSDDSNADDTFVNVAYQKVFDKEGNLSKLMLLTKDITESRKREMQMEAERLQHENEMKTILGVANTPEEEMIDFMKDTKTRLDAIMAKIASHLEGVAREREQYPDRDAQYAIPQEDVDILYRDLHTLKGNGGSYGFELFSTYAHEAEDRLEELRSPVSIRRSDTLESMKHLLEKMQAEYGAIDEKVKLINGSKEMVYVSVPAERVEYIQTLTRDLIEEYGEEKIPHELFATAEKLSWKPFLTQGRKYQKSAMKAARSLKKEIEFVFVDENKLVPGDIFKGVDESIMHIVRNAVAHGIEPNEVRQEKNKGIGQVLFSVDFDEEKRIIKIADDGAGIDRDVILKKAIERGLTTEQDASNLSDQDVYAFLFDSGFSTADSLSDISGRGVGLDVVKDNIERANGTVEITSQVTVGTTFEIRLPR